MGDSPPEGWLDKGKRLVYINAVLGQLPFTSLILIGFFARSSPKRRSRKRLL